MLGRTPRKKNLLLSCTAGALPWLLPGSAESPDLLTPQCLCRLGLSAADTPPPAPPGWAVLCARLHPSAAWTERGAVGELDLDDCPPCPRKPGEPNGRDGPSHRPSPGCSELNSCPHPCPPRALSPGLKSSGRWPAGARKHADRIEPFLSRPWGPPGQGARLILFLFLE